MDKHISLSPCPFCGMGLTLDIDEEGGVAILHSLKGEKNCWFPSIVEIEMPVETTLEEMVEILNRRPIQESFEHALVGTSLVDAARLQDKYFEIQDINAELARRDEQIAELTATTHSQAFRNAELSRFVWWVYQVYARNVQELTSGITEACTYETEEKAEKGKYGLPIRCWEYIRYLEEYTAGIYNGTYLDSETSTGVKDPPAGHWKSQACIATKRMLELTAFLRKIMLLGLLRGSPRLRDEALRILDGFEPSPSDISTTQNVTTPQPPEVQE